MDVQYPYIVAQLNNAMEASAGNPLAWYGQCEKIWFQLRKGAKEHNKYKIVLPKISERDIVLRLNLWTQYIKRKNKCTL